MFCFINVFCFRSAFITTSYTITDNIGGKVYFFQKECRKLQFGLIDTLDQ